MFNMKMPSFGQEDIKMFKVILAFLKPNKKGKDNLTLPTVT